MIDESHLPVAEQSLLFRLRKRAEIRRQIPGRCLSLECSGSYAGSSLMNEEFDRFEEHD